MKRKLLIPAICLLIASVLLTACQKEDIRSKNGTVVQDKEGHTHVIMTNEDGQTVVDEDGSLVELLIGNDGEPVTLADGQQETSAVTFPDIVTGKNKVELAGLEMPVPDGWDNNSTVYISFTHKDNKKSQGTFSLRKTEKYSDLESAVEVQRDLIESNTDDETDITLENVELANTFMYRRTMYSSSAQTYMIRYLFENDGSVYIADCTVNSEYYDDISFDDIVNSIVLK